jgi:carbonic anhydrase
MSEGDAVVDFPRELEASKILRSGERGVSPPQKKGCKVRQGIRATMLLLGCIALKLGAPVSQSQQSGKEQAGTPKSTTWETPWSYEGERGPEHWGDLDPEYALCRDGHAQSPIDIKETEKADLPPLRFDYKSGPLNIINNGYTAVRVDYEHSGDFLTVGEERYELTQFHFHRPSEEKIRGKQYDMVAHLVHASTEGKVAILAVLLEEGNANPLVAKLWKYMPSEAGPGRHIDGVEVDPAGLLPHDLGYYTYMGSQTAPPCTEGVTWFVLKKAMQVSRAQIEAFAKLYPHDARPVQALNGRVVKESR